MHALISTQLMIWRKCSGILWNFLFPVFCLCLLPCELKLPQPPYTPRSVSSVQGNKQILLGSSLLCHCLGTGNILQVVNWNNCRFCLICFLTLSEHYLLLPDVIYLVHCFVLFFSWEGNSGPCYPTLARSGSPITHF